MIRRESEDRGSCGYMPSMETRLAFALSRTTFRTKEVLEIEKRKVKRQAEWANMLFGLIIQGIKILEMQNIFLHVPRSADQSPRQRRQGNAMLLFLFNFFFFCSDGVLVMVVPQKRQISHFCHHKFCALPSGFRLSSNNC